MKTPDEIIQLLGPPPREVPPSLEREVAGTYHRIFLLVGPLVLIFPFVFCWIFLHWGNPWEEKEIRQKGKRVTGLVIGCEATGGRVNNRRVYALRVAYAPGPGKQKLATFFALQPVRPGTRVKVAYLPQDPGKAALCGVETAADAFGRVFVWILPVMLFPAVITLIIGVILWRRAQRRRSLLRVGELTKGKIVSLGRSVVKQGMRRLLKVRYVFEAPPEGEIEGRQLIHPRYGPDLQEGMEIPVAYDPDWPYRSVVILPGYLPEEEK